MMKDRTDIESTQTEVAWARIELDVAMQRVIEEREKEGCNSVR